MQWELRRQADPMWAKDTNTKPKTAEPTNTEPETTRPTTGRQGNPSTYHHVTQHSTPRSRPNTNVRTRPKPERMGNPLDPKEINSAPEGCKQRIQRTQTERGQAPGWEPHDIGRGANVTGSPKSTREHRQPFIRPSSDCREQGQTRCLRPGPDEAEGKDLGQL